MVIAGATVERCILIETETSQFARMKREMRQVGACSYRS